MTAHKMVDSPGRIWDWAPDIMRRVDGRRAERTNVPGRARFHRGQHRATRYSLRVSDIKAALHAERDWNDALCCGPITVPGIVTYLIDGTGRRAGTWGLGGGAA